MPDTLFISYKSEEHPFALKLAAGLKNRGINVWIDRMDIHPGDDWDEAIDHALKHLCRGMIVILTPDYLKSRVCHDEWSYALEKNLPVIPVLLRRLNDDDIQFRLRRIQRLEFLDWLDERAYQAKIELLVERIQHDQSNSFGDIPSAEIQYLTSLIADLESQQGVENYIALSAQSEIVRVDPRPRKNIEPSLALLLKPSTPERDVRPETKKIDNIQQAVADHAKFVLIGDPGAGKTTTLRRLALEMAQKRLEALKSGDTTPPLPFIAYLPRWSTEPTAADFIRRQWAATNMGGDVVGELKSGQVRLYLDGLNEMGGEGKNKAALLGEWLQSPDGPRHAIITCRQGDYHDDLDLKLPTVLVEPLTDEKIGEFTVQYLGKEQAGPFLKKVFPQYIKDDWEFERKRKNERSLVHLARNPYLLAALTIIFDEGGDLPRNTGALFQQLVRVLWERERLRQTPGWMPFEEMQAAFGNLAFNMIDEDQPVDVSLNYTRSLLGRRRLFSINYQKADRLLKLGASAGLITINSDEMRFSHQLMLEYFAAAGLWKAGLTTKLQKPSMGIFSRDTTKWDEVVVALCGVVSDPEAIVNQVVGIDPFLAADCLVSGIEVSALVRTKVIDTLSPSLCDANSNVRSTAAWALGNIGEAAIPALLDALRGADREARHEAERALGNIGEPTIPALLDVLHDPDWGVHSGAVRTLFNIGEPAIPMLLGALHDPDSNVRDGVVSALSLIRDPATIPALVEALSDPDSKVRDGVVFALSRIGTSAIPTLVDVLRAADSPMRSQAASALGNIGDSAAIPALLGALHDLDWAVRYEAVSALGTIGDPAAVLSLIEQLADTEESLLLGRICDVAAEALEKIGTPEALEAVRRWRKEQDGSGKAG